MTGLKWEKSGHLRRAGINALSIGGSNAHITIEEANPISVQNEESFQLLSTNQHSEVIFLSANTLNHLSKTISKYINFADKISMAELTDLAAYTSKEFHTANFRIGMVVESPDEFSQYLKCIHDILKNGYELSSVHKILDRVFTGRITNNFRLGIIFSGDYFKLNTNLQLLWKRFPFLNELSFNTLNNIDQRKFKKYERGVQKKESIRRSSFISEMDRFIENKDSPSFNLLSALSILKIFNYYGMNFDIGIGVNCCGLEEIKVLLRSKENRISNLNDFVLFPANSTNYNEVNIQNLIINKPDIYIEVGTGELGSRFKDSHCLTDKKDSFPILIKDRNIYTLLNTIYAKLFTVGYPLSIERLFDFRFNRNFDPYNYNPKVIVNPCEL
jgi:hypothetical protein